MLSACTPSNATEAEARKDVAWLSRDGSPGSVAALGRIADGDKKAQDVLETLSQQTESARTLDGGAGALDVWLAVWNGVERNAAWAPEMLKRALADHDRMNDAASSIKRGSSQVGAFVVALDGAMKIGCDVRCAGVLASTTGPIATNAISQRLQDDKTREAMCAGLGSAESSKDARLTFTRAAESSRNAPACTGAAAQMAKTDDDVLTWLGQGAEPGLLRAAAASDALPCVRIARIWSTAFVSRDHAAYGALALPLGAAVKRCPKELDVALAAAMGSDADAQTLAVSAIDTRDANARDLPHTCAALPNVARHAASPQTKARAEGFLSRCGR